jgi:hypothetical protein
MTNNSDSKQNVQIANYIAGLHNRGLDELERELAQYCFDQLFIQTQLEVSQSNDEESVLTRRVGEQRLLRLQTKIDALKKEIFDRTTIEN